jgi:hypothetical protein
MPLLSLSGKIAAAININLNSDPLAWLIRRIKSLAVTRRRLAPYGLSAPIGSSYDFMTPARFRTSRIARPDLLAV